MMTIINIFTLFSQMKMIFKGKTTKKNIMKYLKLITKIIFGVLTKLIVGNTTICINI